MAVFLTRRTLFRSAKKHDTEQSELGAQALVVSSGFFCLALGGLMMAAIEDAAIGLGLGIPLVAIALCLGSSFLLESLVVCIARRRGKSHQPVAVADDDGINLVPMSSSSAPAITPDAVTGDA